MSSPFFQNSLVLPEGEDVQNLRFERIDPRVSLHRLAQFEHFSPAERRAAVTSEKHPSFYRVSYGAARSLFCEALRLGWSGDQFFSTARQRWLEGVPENFIDIRRRDLSIEAASRFVSLLGSLRRNLAACDVRVSVAKGAWSPLVLGGVRVECSPPVVLRRTRHGVDEVGLLSFHMSKSRPHSRDDARTAAVLLYEFAGVNRERLGDVVEPALCLVADVFSGVMSDGDFGRRRRMANATLACEEIASLWSAP